jgi:iron complex transport system ATP-binding protein
MEEPPVMDIRHMKLAYGERVLAADISFHIEEGECVLLAGANGCGKSTLLRRLATDKCILIPTGIPKVKGFTVEEFIRTGCYRESNWAGKLSGEMEKRLTDALERLGLNGQRRQDISTLSDGEFQKACIAVGLVRKADILLLGEPTAYLDVENRLMVLETLRSLAQQTGMAVLFSSHDLADALKVARRVLAFTPGGGFLESTTENRPEVLRAAFPMWE